MASPKFQLKKDNHEVTTSLASEATQLRAAGYKDVKKSAPAAKPTQDKK